MAEEKPKDWVDFAAANSVHFGDVVSALGLDVKRTGGVQWQGVCPLHEQKGEGRRESFGFNEAKGVFNCFACKKSGDLIRFIAFLKGIGAKDAAQWLMSLVNNGDVRESVQVESAAVSAAGNGAVSGEPVPEGEARAATSAHFSEREAWLVGVIAQGVAWYLAETFKPLSDVETMEKCIVAKVAMAAGMFEATAQGTEEGRTA